jgi:hypothetical protein
MIHCQGERKRAAKHYMAVENEELCRAEHGIIAQGHGDSRSGTCTNGAAFQACGERLRHAAHSYGLSLPVESRRIAAPG